MGQKADTQPFEEEPHRAESSPENKADGNASAPDNFAEFVDRDLPVAVWLAEIPKFRFTFVSGASESLLGYPSEIWTEPSFWDDHVYPEDRGWVVARRSQAVKTHSDYNAEYRLVSNAGEAVWVREIGRVLSAQASGQHLAGVIVDLSKWRTGQKSLGEDHRWLRQIIDTIPVQIWSGPADGTLDYCNARWRNELGLTLDQLQGDGWQKMLHPEDRERVLHAWQVSVMNGSPYEQKERHLMATGQYLWFLCRGVPLRNEKGEVLRWFGANTDIDGQEKAEQALRESYQRLRLLLDLSHHFISKLETRELFNALQESLRRLIGWDWATILLPDTGGDRLSVYLSPDNAYLREGFSIPVQGSLQGAVYRSGKPIYFRIEDLSNLCGVYRKNQWMQEIARDANIKAGYSLPLLLGGRVIGVLFLMTRTPQDFTEQDVGFFTELASLVAAALSNSLQFDRANASQLKLISERRYIDEQVRSEAGFEEIVGESAALRNVLTDVSTVAPTDSTVLITGDTGTGKELIARAIHDRSLRRDYSFIKVDCTAIPATLMESELFGHERGAFTGAINQRLGRFEAADQGTLFLDEVGEVPLELQTKLLRVLQDHAFERIGSNQTRRVDVRVIAATNRDLEMMVESGKFREDLYYRLKVFPIIIPPLRERSSDIPPLVTHYVAKYARRMKKDVSIVPTAVMNVFMRYAWPGNVRELQHFIERSVIVSRGKVLQAPVRELERAIDRRHPSRARVATDRTLQQIERESILQALKESNWIVGGPHGAAVKLGLKRTTLASMMERLGIWRPHNK